MEQRTLKNASKYLNTNINSYLETSDGQSSNLYLNVVHFFNSRDLSDRVNQRLVFPLMSMDFRLSATPPPCLLALREQLKAESCWHLAGIVYVDLPGP